MKLLDFFIFPTHHWFINHLKHLGSKLGTSNHLPGMALTPLPSVLALDRIQTDDLSIVSRVLYH